MASSPVSDFYSNMRCVVLLTPPHYAGNVKHYFCTNVFRLLGPRTGFEVRAAEMSFVGWLESQEISSSVRQEALSSIFGLYFFCG